MLLYDENISGSSVSELRYGMFAKKNLSGDRLPTTLDTLVLHLRRALIFFHQCLLNNFSQLFLHLSKICNIISKNVYRSFLHKTSFFV